MEKIISQLDDTLKPDFSHKYCCDVFFTLQSDWFCAYLSDVFLRLYQTSVMELFCKNCYRLSSINPFLANVPILYPLKTPWCFHGV